MQINELPKMFINALPVIDIIERANFEAYFVGGAVRDLLLKKDIHDIDIATSAFPEEIKSLFSKTIDTGIQHGTVTVGLDDEYYEVTTFRTESTYQDYRRPDHVSFVRNLKDDLMRRDFTINALALNAKGEVIDLYHGIDDLDAKIIRAVGVASERFNEDALRMMRAVRFMSQLDFSLEENTRQAIAKHAELLEKIAIERIREEFVKMGLGVGFKNGFQTFLETGLYLHVPFLNDKKDELENILNIKQNPESESVLWALICIMAKFDIAKSKKFLRAWKNSNEITDETIKIIDFFDLISVREPDNIELFNSGKVIINRASELANMLDQPINQSLLIDRYDHLAIKDRSELVVDGNYLIKTLHVQPGPLIGKILDDVLNQVILNQLENNQEAITKYIENDYNVLS